MDPDPVLFISGFQETNKKSFICFLLTVGSQPLKSHKTVKIKVFSTKIYLLLNGSGSPGSLHIVTDRDPGGQKTNGSGTLQYTIDITFYMIFYFSLYKIQFFIFYL
jgi:hypothetical protein